MTTKFIIITLLLVFPLSCSNNYGINQLIENGNLITSVLNDLENQKVISSDSAIIYLNISESKNKQMIARVAIFDEEGFNISYNIIGYPVGFFIYKKNTVMVFGDNTHLYFKRSSKKHFFDYLPKNNLQKNESRIIAFPPVNYEPTVYVYEINNDECNFIKCERSLLSREILFEDDSTIIEIWKGDTLTIITK
jgi:hypothetical protein